MHANLARQATANQLSERIVGGAFQSLNPLRAGFPNKLTANALAHTLRKSGSTVAQQRGITIT